jgi:hypothetical protein
MIRPISCALISGAASVEGERTVPHSPVNGKRARYPRGNRTSSMSGSYSTMLTSCGVCTNARTRASSRLGCGNASSRLASDRDDDSPNASTIRPHQKRWVVSKGRGFFPAFTRKSRLCLSAVIPQRPIPVGCLDVPTKDSHFLVLLGFQIGDVPVVERYRSLFFIKVSLIRT